MSHVFPIISAPPTTLHTMNFALSVPVIGLVTGVLSGVIPVLAAFAALVLYSLQIVDWFERRRVNRAAKLPFKD